MNHIYTLTCPIINTVVYVGNTASGFDNRSKAHMTPQGSEAKKIHTRKLRALGLRYISEIIEEVEDSKQSFKIET